MRAKYISESKLPYVYHAKEESILTPDNDKDGTIFKEWLEAKMILLPKKGDLSEPKNWRGICLLDVASKILSTILDARMTIVQRDNGLEEQTGFRPNRGTTDGSFNLIQALLKRKEHGLDTWVLFIDLVKAFDSVNHEAAFTIMKKFGFPNHFINIVIRLHKNATINFNIDSTSESIQNTIGVRQGSVEGPSIFLFIMQAAIETMTWPVPKPEFCTRFDEDAKTHGERWNRRYQGGKGKDKKLVDTFMIWNSLFADDDGVLFNSRNDLIVGTNYFYHHLLRFGLQMHVGQETESKKEPSKTEAMYCPAKTSSYIDGDKSDVKVGNGFISFTDKFKYLGSVIHYSLTSTADIDARINQANAAFGALRKPVFSNKHISDHVKGSIYNALVITTLIYGCENWCMTENLMRKLQTFHNSCVRAMCRVSIRQTIKYHIRSKDLYKKLNTQPIQTFLYNKLLRWIGHVARMDKERLPRKILTSWVANRRPIGRPTMNFGHTLKKALEYKNLPTEFIKWSKIAAEKDLWRSFCSIKKQDIKSK